MNCFFIISFCIDNIKKKKIQNIVNVFLFIEKEIWLLNCLLYFHGSVVCETIFLLKTKTNILSLRTPKQKFKVI